MPKQHNFCKLVHPINRKQSTFQREGYSRLKGINEWLKQIAHNYALIVIAAILFFAVKALIGFITYRHYDKQLKMVNQKLNTLLEDKNKMD
ncbi:hypothetical protein [Paenibacillus illinoisensis]|uniref:hypothetical protein n=1 Tax=Paenibacillus illinoisensis TaxID=59845 RepID=UPI0021AE1E4F|nr:hypothetical protein [Paenibacillus illinoisensis]